jgi:hypothetical protein
MSDKPYDTQAARERGYAGAQAAISQRLGNLSWMERLGLRLDPTLAVGKLEENLPGTIGAWENNTGNQFRPGWLSSTINTWKKGGNPKYYTYDAAGQRHYIE